MPHIFARRRWHRLYCSRDCAHPRRTVRAGAKGAAVKLLLHIGDIGRILDVSLHADVARRSPVHLCLKTGFVAGVCDLGLQVLIDRAAEAGLHACRRYGVFGLRL